MTPFDGAWWDARCLVDGKINTGGVPYESGHSHVAWIRWRLIDELLGRFYTDIGLEPGFGLLGTELYNVALYSPTCRRAPRYFGRLCGVDVHPEDDRSLVGSPGGVELGWVRNDPADLLAEGRWETWTDYLQGAISTLGLATAGVVGHEGCFHRRGKALTHLMFRVALLLRTNGGKAAITDDCRMTTITSNASLTLPDAEAEVVALLRSAIGTIPGGPPRIIAVSPESGIWVLMRTDGLIATRAGAVDAGDLWRRGADVTQIVDAIKVLT